MDDRPLFIVHRLLSFLHPRGFLRRHLLERGAVLLVCAGQVARGHEEFIYDLAAGKHKRFFQDLNTITTVKG